MDPHFVLTTIKTVDAPSVRLGLPPMQQHKMYRQDESIYALIRPEEMEAAKQPLTGRAR